MADLPQFRPRHAAATRQPSSIRAQRLRRAVLCQENALTCELDGMECETCQTSNVAISQQLSRIAQAAPDWFTNGTLMRCQLRSYELQCSGQDRSLSQLILAELTEACGQAIQRPLSPPHDFKVIYLVHAKPAMFEMAADQILSATGFSGAMRRLVISDGEYTSSLTTLKAFAEGQTPEAPMVFILSQPKRRHRLDSFIDAMKHIGWFAPGIIS